MSILYTDGGNNIHKNTGAWAFLSIDLENKEIYTFGGYEYNTTNNRMELYAIIQGLKFYKNQNHIIIHTDSELTMNCAIGKYKKKANLDLWKAYDSLSKDKKIEWIKVKAHSGDKYNTIVDNICTKLIQTEKK